MADLYVNNEQNIIKDSLKYIISEKKLAKIWENKSPKLIWSPPKFIFSHR